MQLRSTARTRFVGALLITSTVIALLAGLVVPAGAALDGAFLSSGPKDRKRQVDQQAKALQAQLHEHSQEVAQAALRLQRAAAQLPAARARLAGAERQVTAAKARDAAAAAKLMAAEQREQKALDELDEVRGRIERTQSVMGEIARANYQRGGVYGEIALVLESESPRELTTRIATMRTVLRSQQDVVEDLDESRADLAVHQSQLAAVREQVGRLRQQAAERLTETRAVEQRAQAAENQVSRLVRDRRSALAQAEGAKAEDARRYRQLRAESRRLAQVLAARSGGVYGASGNLLRPVPGPVTSPYGMRRHPITGEYKLHDGTDFSASCSTPVKAATAGEVVRTAALTGYGNQVALDHGRVSGVNLATSYNHLSQFAVSPGERVNRGQVVGYVGSTGYSTGCHLHFMVYENGNTVDPMKWL